MSSFSPGSSSVNWTCSSSRTFTNSHRRYSNIDPYSRSSSSTHRTSSSRYGENSGYSSYGARDPSGYRDHRSESRDAVAGAFRRESERDSRRDDYGYSSTRDHESSYSRFPRERAERDTGYSSYSGSREAHRSSNSERDTEHATRRGATAGMWERERSGSKYGHGTQRESSAYRSRQDSERQASGGARQGERSGSAATAGWSGYRRSSAEGRHAFSPDDYYKYW